MESWLQRYNDRERLLIESCRSYAANTTRIVLPGHNLMVMVAALSAQLDEAYSRLKGGAGGVPQDSPSPSTGGTGGTPCRGSGGVSQDFSISNRSPEDGPAPGPQL